MDNQKKIPGAVTAAGIVAIICSLLVLFGALMGFLGLSIMPPTKGPGLSPLAMKVAEGMLGFVVAFGALGFSSGVGLLRLKNWARIFTLIWSGLTVVFSALVIGMLAISPFPQQPNSPVSPGFVRMLALAFYAVPLGIGIWWLVLFNKKEVAARFARPPSVPLDVSGFPASTERQTKSQGPLPLMVLGGFFLLSSLSVFLAFFFPVPVMLFGHPMRGLPGMIFWSASCFGVAVAGIGLLRVRPWGYWLALALQVFWFLSGSVTMMSSNYWQYMQEALAQMRERLGDSYSNYSVEQMRPYSLMGLLVPLLILALLVFCRARFFEAADARDRS